MWSVCDQFFEVEETKERVEICNKGVSDKKQTLLLKEKKVALCEKLSNCANKAFKIGLKLQSYSILMLHKK